MSINEVQAQIMDTRAWRASVWYRRLFLVSLILWPFVALFVDETHMPIAVAAVPLVVACVAQPCWHLTVRRAPVDQDTRWIAMLNVRYIADPMLRRQHRREVFWLPRR
jgi:hypothetical protein